MEYIQGSAGGKASAPIIRAKFLKIYYDKPNRCKECNKIIKVKPHQKITEIRQRTFCSRSCSAIYNNRLKYKDKSKRYCKFCGKNELTHKKNNYCSRDCFNQGRYIEYIEKWKKGEISGFKNPEGVSNHIRRYLFESNDSKCSKCGWSEINKHTKKVPLQINHKNGRYRDCSEDNLELICPNCHALTFNYGSRNKGNGRVYRNNWKKSKKL